MSILPFSSNSLPYAEFERRPAGRKDRGGDWQPKKEYPPEDLNPDFGLRKPALYPVELRGRINFFAADPQTQGLPSNTTNPGIM